MFSPKHDMQEWRRSVGKWANMIKIAHDQGNDRTYQITFKILGQVLYAKGLPREQQKIVDEAREEPGRSITSKRTTPSITRVGYREGCGY